MSLQKNRRSWLRQLAVTIGLLGCVLVAGVAIWLPVGDDGFQWSNRSAILVSMLLTCSAMGVSAVWTFYAFDTSVSLYLIAIAIVVLVVLTALTVVSIGPLLIPGLVLMTIAAVLMASAIMAG